jgi:hypothetical protein
MDNVIENRVYDVDGVEIFKAGLWNGDKYTEDDLDEMVKAFDAIGDKIKPYLKLGHTEKQALLQKEGLPAAGWITNLKRVGDTLVAKFSSIPQKIYELIVNKAYGRFSSEIYWNLKDSGKTYKRVLKAVALLGADTPAVTTLDDFINLYIENIEAESIRIYKEGPDMDKNELDVRKYEEQISELSEKLKLYEQQTKVAIEENDKLKKFIEEKAVEAQKAEIKFYLESKAQEGKVLPAQMEKFTELALKDFDSVKAVIENNPKFVEFESKSQHVEVKPSEVKSEGDELDGKIKDYMKANPNVNYSAAYNFIAMQEVR